MPVPIYMQHCAVFKQQSTHASIIKSHLASKPFINTVLETIAIKASTQLSSGYQKLRGLPRNPGYEVNPLKTGVLITYL